MRILTLANFKGGVGKSVLAASIAQVAQAKDVKTLLVDLDTLVPFQKTVFGIEQSEGLSQVTDALKLWSSLDSNAGPSVRGLWPEAELVIVDTGPGLSPLLEAAISESDEILIVTDPYPQSLLSAFRFCRFVSSHSWDAGLSLVTNRFPTVAQAKIAYGRLQVTSARFLGVSVRHGGTLLEYPAISHAWLRQCILSKDHLPKQLVNQIEGIIKATETTVTFDEPHRFFSQALDDQLAA